MVHLEVKKKKVFPLSFNSVNVLFILGSCFSTAHMRRFVLLLDEGVGLTDDAEDGRWECLLEQHQGLRRVAGEMHKVDEVSNRLLKFAFINLLVGFHHFLCQKLLTNFWITEINRFGLLLGSSSSGQNLLLVIWIASPLLVEVDAVA